MTTKSVRLTGVSPRELGKAVDAFPIAEIRVLVNGIRLVDGACSARLVDDGVEFTLPPTLADVKDEVLKVWGNSDGNR